MELRFHHPTIWCDSLVSKSPEMVATAKSGEDRMLRMFEYAMRLGARDGFRDKRLASIVQFNGHTRVLFARGD